MSRYIELINGAKHIAIYTHINTDGDAIGSCLTMRKMLINMGKKADIFVDSTIPYHIQFLPGIDCLNKKTCENYDLHIALDSASLDRLGKYKFKFGKKVPTLQIDHHPGNPNFAESNIVDSEVSSTGELLYNVISSLGQKCDADMAQCLIVAMLTDSGNLTFSNAKVSTFAVMSKLLKVYGNTIDTITNPLNNSISMDVFNLKKYVYETLEFAIDDKLAICVLDKDIFEKTHTSIDDTKGLVYVPFELKSVKIAAILSRGSDGAVHGSIRSKGKVVASAIAESFGGGGHVNAAGFKSYESIEKIKNQIIEEAKKVLA